MKIVFILLILSSVLWLALELAFAPHGHEDKNGFSHDL
jgi:hypothetical protein